jgi:ParB family transcriptional regulator, chromosome partitioning protein
MKIINMACTEMDLHRLDLRYADTRVNSSTALNRLVNSIEQYGQLIPVTVVADGQQTVLIDGYLRVLALQRCGRDTAHVFSWECSIEHALLVTLAHEQARGWEALEEANILRALCDRGLSQREIAMHIGRDVSWVSRRLQLLEGMSEDILRALRHGELSTWSATRILMPLARANTDHAKCLLKALKKAPLSSRDLNELYKQYNQSDKNTRERLVRNPQLFKQAQQTQREVREAKRLRDGPEGQWKETLNSVGQRLNHLIRQAPLLFTQALDKTQRDDLLAPYRKAQHLWQKLKHALSVDLNKPNDEGGEGDLSGKRADRAQASPTGDSDTRDLPDTQCHAQGRTPHYTPPRSEACTEAIATATG